MKGNETGDLWIDVGNACLDRAKAILEEKGDISIVKTLIDATVELEMVNLRWAEQSRSALPASLLRKQGPHTKES